MTATKIEIKGMNGGLLVLLPELSAEQQHAALLSTIQKEESFLKGARMALDLGSTLWTEEQLGALEQDLADEGLCLFSVFSTCVQTSLAAKHRNIPLSAEFVRGKKYTTEVAEIPASLQMESAPSVHWIRRSLSANEELSFEGDVIVLGNVPKGAKLKASGSLIIWGSVGGCVHAGRGSEAILCMLSFDGEEASLGGLSASISRPERRNGPLCLIIEDAKVKVQTWNLPRRGLF